MIEKLDHVQISMPAGGELGLPELEKPATLAGRGGVWFALPNGRQLHLGVEEPFVPGKKAHPAFSVSDLDGLARAPWRRFYGRDPFGNRIEFLEA